MPPPKVRPLQTATACASSGSSRRSPSGVDVAAGQLDAPAGEDGAKGRLGVGEAAAEERRRGRRVAVDEAADAGREHVEPVPLDRPAVEVGESRPAYVDGAFGTAREGGEVRTELVRDPERAAEVAAGAGADDAERGERGGVRAGSSRPPRRPPRSPAGCRRRSEQAVDDLVERAVAAQPDHQWTMVASRRCRQSRRVAAAPRLGDIEVADRAADGGQQLREAAAGAAAAGGRIGDDQRPLLGAGDGSRFLHGMTVPDAGPHARGRESPPPRLSRRRWPSQSRSPSRACALRRRRSCASPPSATACSPSPSPCSRSNSTSRRAIVWTSGPSSRTCGPASSASPSVSP